MSANTAALARLQSRLGYQFVSSEHLTLALTHRSAGNPHNQRLEFLGDAALGFVIAEWLYRSFVDAPEGQLSQYRANLVNRETLAAVARELFLGENLCLGPGERKSGGRERDSILCDAMEAVFGAVYLDGGAIACRDCILRLLAQRLKNTVELNQLKDSKTRLQELMQSRNQPLPKYEVIDISGEEHEQLFTVDCTVGLLSDATQGVGRSRRVAEQQAAHLALVQIER